MWILIAATAIGLVTGLFVALNIASIIWAEDVVRAIEPTA
jgi:hypothetical protein